MSAEDLQDGEVVRDGDSVVEACLAIDRALRLWPRLRAEPRLRALRLGCDLGGNEAEVAAWAAEVAARGLPPALVRLVLDRSGRWDLARPDELELSEDRLSLQIGEPGDTAPVLAALESMLARAPTLSTIEVGMHAPGRNPIDAALTLLSAAGPWPRVEALRLGCSHPGSRDRVQWLAISELAGLLAACPSLVTLSLPRAELSLDSLAHPTLRELELGWLGGAPCGPFDAREWGPHPTPRASGLEFLRTARLPALERLAIDFQYEWYVGWSSADLAALCESSLPRLGRLELRYCMLADELLRRLPHATWAGQLERLEITGLEFDAATAAALVAARPRLPRLRELWCFRPGELDDSSWGSLCAAYDVRTPA